MEIIYMLRRTTSIIMSNNNDFVKALSTVAARTRDLYPEIEPYNTGMLKVSDLHTIYYEQCGNPNGKPVLMIHGGPGGSCSLAPAMRRFHDPKKYRIILHDQRGSGSSKPFAEVRENTTWDLVSDIEKLREHLGLTGVKCQVFGGSWGSTLALTYAIKHPSFVSELVLRGIFLVNNAEINFFYQQGASYIYPEAWEPYRDFIPEAERGDFVKAYHKRLFGEDEAVRLMAARQWSRWELATSFSLAKPDAELDAKSSDGAFALPFARIENHYFVNKGFFDRDDWILHQAAEALKDIPTVIVSGRFDVVTHFASAFELKKRMPHAEWHVCPFSGHASTEPDVQQFLLTATDKFAPAE